MICSLRGDDSEPLDKVVSVRLLCEVTVFPLYLFGTGTSFHCALQILLFFFFFKQIQFVVVLCCQIMVSILCVF